MLNYSAKAFAASPTRVVTGQFLAKNRLCKRDRARLAADILAGKARVIEPTVKQISLMCGVSVPYINEARGLPPPKSRKLLRDWAAATDAERVEFARRAGAEAIFDVIVQVA